MKEDKSGLWYRVLLHKYGQAGRDLTGRERDSSSWWKDVFSVEEGIWGFNRDWFSNLLKKRVGNGVDTQFWKDPWCERGVLSSCFGRLYALSCNKEATVADLRKQSASGGEWVWRWRRNLFTWEEELVAQLNAAVQNIELQEIERDRWFWREEASGIYSVKSAYRSLMKNFNQDSDRFHQKVWNKFVPTKVSILVWRLLQNRVPTKDNLIRRGIIGGDQHACNGGCQNTETEDHLFFGCPIAYKVWMEIIRWLGNNTVMHTSGRNHLEQFEGLLQGDKATKNSLMTIWFVCIWATWKTRNQAVFKAKSMVIADIVENAKLYSWNWLNSRSKGFIYPITFWMLNPAECLGL